MSIIVKKNEEGWADAELFDVDKVPYGIDHRMDIVEQPSTELERIYFECSRNVVAIVNKSFFTHTDNKLEECPWTLCSAAELRFCIPIKWKNHVEVIKSALKDFISTCKEEEVKKRALDDLEKVEFGDYKKMEVKIPERLRNQMVIGDLTGYAIGGDRILTCAHIDDGYDEENWLDSKPHFLDNPSDYVAVFDFRAGKEIKKGTKFPGWQVREIERVDVFPWRKNETLPKEGKYHDRFDVAVLKLKSLSIFDDPPQRPNPLQISIFPPLVDTRIFTIGCPSGMPLKVMEGRITQDAPKIIERSNLTNKTQLVVPNNVSVPPQTQNYPLPPTSSVLPVSPPPEKKRGTQSITIPINNPMPQLQTEKKPTSPTTSIPSPQRPKLNTNENPTSPTLRPLPKPPQKGVSITAENPTSPTPRSLPKLPQKEVPNTAENPTSPTLRSLPKPPQKGTTVSEKPTPESTKSASLSGPELVVSSSPGPEEVLICPFFSLEQEMVQGVSGGPTICSHDSLRSPLEIIGVASYMRHNTGSWKNIKRPVVKEIQEVLSSIKLPDEIEAAFKDPDPSSSGVRLFYYLHGPNLLVSADRKSITYGKVPEGDIGATASKFICRADPISMISMPIGRFITTSETSAVEMEVTIECKGSQSFLRDGGKISLGFGKPDEKIVQTIVMDLQAEPSIQFKILAGFGNTRSLQVPNTNSTKPGERIILGKDLADLVDFNNFNGAPGLLGLTENNSIYFDFPSSVFDKDVPKCSGEIILTYHRGPIKDWLYNETFYFRGTLEFQDKTAVGVNDRLSGRVVFWCGPLLKRDIAKVVQF